jgi:hypothetical protein
MIQPMAQAHVRVLEQHEGPRRGYHVFHFGAAGGPVASERASLTKLLVLAEPALAHVGLGVFHQLTAFVAKFVAVVLVAAIKPDHDLEVLPLASYPGTACCSRLSHVNFSNRTALLHIHFTHATQFINHHTL